MDKTKINPKYLSNPRLHLRELREFRERLMAKHILGEADPEWRQELEFILERCNETIKEVQEKIL